MTANGANAPPRTPVSHRLLWSFLVTVLIAIAILTVRSRLAGGGAIGEARRLPVLGEVPPFSLIERSGRALTRDDLSDHVWIADFIFTRCAGICPVMTSSMSRIQEGLADAPSVRLVSVSVDPEWDTLEVLREYAEGVAADSARWLFATGDKRAIYRLSQEGFRLGVADAETTAQGVAFAGRDTAAAADAGDAVLHSSYFVLVDGQARIRGYYDGSDEKAVAQIARHARALERLGGR